MCQQQRLASETIQVQDEPSIRDLLLPQSSTVFGAWTLTLQLLGAADIIDKPQGVTKALEKVLSDAASPLGLRLLGVTALEPRGASRGLRGLSRSGHLLGGSVEGGDDADTDVASFESSEGAAPQTASLYVRAIIATSAAEQGEGVAALVRLARTEAVAVWGERLSAAGLPVAGIEVVSLQPHAPTSIEAKLQAQLMIVQELHGTGSGGSNGSGTTATLTVSDYEVPSADAYRSPAMGPGGVPSLVAAAALCAGLAGLAMLRARRAASRQAAASSVILSVADGKALAV